MTKPRRNAIDQIELIRNALAFTLVVSFVSAIIVFTFKAIPSSNRDLLTYMIGQLSGMATMALGFYFVNKVGQDALDAKRTDNTAKALDAITATANVAAGSSPSPDDAIRPGDEVRIEKPEDDQEPKI